MAYCRKRKRSRHEERYVNNLYEGEFCGEDVNVGNIRENDDEQDECGGNERQERNDFEDWIENDEQPQNVDFDLLEVDFVDERKYYRMQEELFKDVFSLDCLRNSNDMESFVNSLRIRSPTEVMFAKLISFQQKAKLSRDLSNEFLSIIQSFEPQLDVPRDWRTIRRYIMKTMKICNSFTLKKTMEWPPHWRMHLWNEPMKKPGKVELLARDPYECIALKLCDPILMYLWREQINFTYVEKFLDTGERCVGDLFTTDYFKYTEADVRRNVDPNAILVPIIAYEDGVSLGLRNKVIVLSRSYYCSQ